jgi:PAS domain-containing protein
MSNAAEKQPEPSLPASTVMTWYQVTLSAIGDAVLTTDPEGRVTYMNPVAETLARQQIESINATVARGGKEFNDPTDG